MNFEKVDDSCRMNFGEMYISFSKHDLIKVFNLEYELDDVRIYFYIVRGEVKFHYLRDNKDVIFELFSIPNYTYNYEEVFDFLINEFPNYTQMNESTFLNIIDSVLHPQLLKNANYIEYKKLP